MISIHTVQVPYRSRKLSTAQFAPSHTITSTLGTQQIGCMLRKITAEHTARRYFHLMFSCILACICCTCPLCILRTLHSIRMSSCSPLKITAEVCFSPVDRDTSHNHFGYFLLKQFQSGCQKMARVLRDVCVCFRSTLSSAAAVLRCTLTTPGVNSQWCPLWPTA